MAFWRFIEEYWARYVDGGVTTLGLFACSSAVTVAIAFLLGLMLLSERRAVRWTATTYVEFFRGTSLLIQLYWIFFVLPIFGVTLPKFTAGFVAVGLNAGAYGAELVRGAIQAVPKGQWEAAYALSMSPFKRMVRIILPQAFLIMLPSWGNLLIDVLKGTALTSLIGIADLMYQAKQINSLTYQSAQAFGLALIFYYVSARFLLTPAMRWLEARLRRNLMRH